VMAFDEQGQAVEVADKVETPQLAAKPALFRAMQKQTLNMNLRRRIVTDVPFGMALEGLTAADQPYQG